MRLNVCVLYAVHAAVLRVCVRVRVSVRASVGVCVCAG